MVRYHGWLDGTRAFGDEAALLRRVPRVFLESHGHEAPEMNRLQVINRISGGWQPCAKFWFRAEFPHIQFCPHFLKEICSATLDHGGCHFDGPLSIQWAPSFRLPFDAIGVQHPGIVGAASLYV